MFPLARDNIPVPLDNVRLSCMSQEANLEMFKQQVTESFRWEGFTGCPATHTQAIMDVMFNTHAQDSCVSYYRSVCDVEIRCCYHR